MWVALLLATSLVNTHAQVGEHGEVTAHLTEAPQPASKGQHSRVPPAVLWLNPLQDENRGFTPAPHGRITLVQKNKMFSPHLLIVPVGSVVFFPNKDPFFHNVFSLFDGKRFDLGLYEAGSTKEVTFSREGVSYIFCNIHPQMSAVVLALSTPFYATADSNGFFHLRGVPEGAYQLHIWVEGEQQSLLARLTKKVEVSSEGANLGEIQLELPPQAPVEHLNKFGKPYHPDENPPY